MRPFGALGCSQLSSSALPCSLCSTVKLAKAAGEASRVLILTHGLNTLPERMQNGRVNDEGTLQYLVVFQQSMNLPVDRNCLETSQLGLLTGLLTLIMCPSVLCFPD